MFWQMLTLILHYTFQKTLLKFVRCLNLLSVTESSNYELYLKRKKVRTFSSVAVVATGTYFEYLFKICVYIIKSQPPLIFLLIAVRKNQNFTKLILDIDSN